MMAKKRNFRMHPKLLYDVIRRQAGTLAKAVLEGAMNSVDAKATHCDITLTDDTLIITDDGEGFPDMRSIELYFETFGQPHDESEKKVYANFRMGRGQLFAFGENVWESGRFRMDVDFKAEGDGYELTDDNEETEGCSVTVFLYDKLSPSDLARVIRDVELYVKWFNIPVYLNEEEVSKDPAGTKWDYESDNCYVKLQSTGGLSVYNLGAFIKEFPGHTYGRGGEVVSKQQLKLNFARNDVMVTECPIWKEVKKFVEAQAGREIQRRPSLNEDERRNLAFKMKYDETPAREAVTQRLVTDVLGRHWAIRNLGYKVHEYPCYTEAPKGDRRGDKIHQMKLAFVIADVTKDRFDCDTVEDLMNLLESTYYAAYGQDSSLERWIYKGFNEVSTALSTTYQLMEEKELTGDEPVWRAMAESYGHLIAMEVQNKGWGEMEIRQIVIGDADHADGWTDAETYIAISRRYLVKLKYANLEDIVKLGNLLLHEYCHVESDMETHTHSPEFYQLFHDSIDSVGKFADFCLRGLPQILDKLDKKASRTRLREMDRIHRLEQKAQKRESKIAARGT